MSSIRSQVSAVLVARVVGAALQAVTGLLFARAVVPSTYGVVMGVAGVLIFVAVVADFGISSVVGRLRARDRSDMVRAGLSASAALALGAIICASLVILLSPLPDELSAVLWLLAVGAMLDKNVDAGLSVLLADSLRLTPAISIVVRRVSTLVAFLLATSAGWAPVLSYALAMASGPLLGWLHMYVHMRALGLARMRLSDISRVVRESAPFAANDVSTQARTLDVVVIAAVATAGTAGLFAAASRLTSPVHLLAGTLASVILPRAARLERAEVGRLGGRLFVASIVATFLLLPIFLVSEQLVVLLFGQEYAGAGAALGWLIVGLPLFVVVAPLSALLQAIDAAGLVARGSAVFSVAILGGVALGAASGGATGAAAAVSLLPLLRAAGLMRSLQRYCAKPGAPTFG